MIPLSKTLPCPEIISEVSPITRRIVFKVQVLPLTCEASKDNTYSKCCNYTAKGDRIRGFLDQFIAS